jgi:hypothetical protein
MEITYHQEGDYLIPDLKLSDTTEYQIGKYGRMRKRFLEENHRGIYFIFSAFFLMFRACHWQNTYAVEK